MSNEMILIPKKIFIQHQKSNAEFNAGGVYVVMEECVEDKTELQESCFSSLLFESKLEVMVQIIFIQLSK